MSTHKERIAEQKDMPCPAWFAIFMMVATILGTLAFCTIGQPETGSAQCVVDRTKEPVEMMDCDLLAELRNAGHRD